MWIVQYMSEDDNFWRTLVFPKGKEKDVLDKMNELHHDGCITRVYKRCSVDEVK